MRQRLLLVLTTSLGVVLSGLWLVCSAYWPAMAQPENEIIRVALSGSDASGCGEESNPCRTVQFAVDQAQEGDEIRIASGVYTDVHVREAITQVVYISKTLDILGGFTTTNWITPELVNNPTTLDAQGLGRVVLISGNISVTLDGLRITGGDATGLGKLPYPNVTYDTGGGIYVLKALAIINNCEIFSNTASSKDQGFSLGGGMYLYKSNYSKITNNIVRDNVAGTGIGIPSRGEGGGLCLEISHQAVISNNLIQNNVAGYGDYSNGGGVFLYNSDYVTMTRNEIAQNIASPNRFTRGGGVYSYLSDKLFFYKNLVRENISSSFQGTDYQINGGGGLFFEEGEYFSILENEILSNTVSLGEGYGGGMFLHGVDHSLVQMNLVRWNIGSILNLGHGGGIGGGGEDLQIISNTIQENIASRDSYGLGGGLDVSGWGVTISQNLISDNDGGLNLSGWGGGVNVDGGETILLDNNLIKYNCAGKDDDSFGGGMLLRGRNITATQNQVLENSSGGEGGGIHSYYGQINLFDNDILSNTADHAGGGIYIYTFNSGTQKHLNRVPVHKSFLARDSSTEDDFYKTYKDSSSYTFGSDDQYPGSSYDALIVGNRIISNTSHQMGGGVVISNATATLINNFIADNFSGGWGSGVVLDRSPAHHGSNQMLLIHNTIAHNQGGDGSGIYVGSSGDYTSTAILTNTILVSHTVGITVAEGNKAILEATLWGAGNWANESDWGGLGIIHTGTVNIWGDPQFVNPYLGDYHIGIGSAARDNGNSAGIDNDIDGEARPFWFAYDIGADEAWPDFIQYFPFIAKMYVP